MNTFSNAQSNIQSVSQLNRAIKTILERDVGPVMVEGEVSNLVIPRSGHAYFSLKDTSAQLRCVFFKNRHPHDVMQTLQDGKKLVLQGTLSLYEARGDYQLIVERLEAKGVGDLYQQFLALKKMLQAAGLFDEQHKKSWPDYPNHIGIITSSTGAAVRDIMTTLNRRFPLADVTLYPSEVQGDAAPPQLIQAIEKANIEAKAEVLILARGGGSIEDLWAFNDEGLAHAIFNSTLPIISGVGHETDFTIADFVADLRAATPTAAAEAATPDISTLASHLERLDARIGIAFTRLLRLQKEQLTHLSARLSSPKTLLESHWQTLDYLTSQLKNSMGTITYHKTSNLKTLVARLHTLSPLATLSRGYSIASFEGKALRASQQAPIGSNIIVNLEKGALACEVKDHVKHNRDKL